MGKGEIARDEQFLLFSQYFLLKRIIVSPFVYIFPSPHPHCGNAIHFIARRWSKSCVNYRGITTGMKFRCSPMRYKEKSPFMLLRKCKPISGHFGGKLSQHEKRDPVEKSQFACTVKVVLAFLC